MMFLAWLDRQLLITDADKRTFSITASKAEYFFYTIETNCMLQVLEQSTVRTYASLWLLLLFTAL